MPAAADPLKDVGQVSGADHRQGKTGKVAKAPHMTVDKENAAIANGAPSDTFSMADFAGPNASSAMKKYLTDQLAAAKKEQNCFTVLGNPLSKEEVTTHWPNRQGYFSKDWDSLEELQKQTTRKSLAIVEDKEGDTVTSTCVQNEHNLFALFHFNAVRCYDPDPEEYQDFTVELGDAIVVRSPELVDEDGNPIDHIIRVTEIFYAIWGGLYFRGQWYYQTIDTDMAYPPTKKKKSKKKKKDDDDEEEEEEKEEEVAYNPNMLLLPLQPKEKRRLWLATVEDNETYTVAYHMDSLLEKVRVLKVTPGRAVADQYPDYNPDTDYYYSQTHSKRCISNEDCYQDWSPFSDLYKAVVKEKGLEAIKELRGVSPTKLVRGGAPVQVSAEEQHPPAPSPPDSQMEHRRIDVLDIFAGAGGLSFMAQNDPGVTIRAKWAVDINASAVETYRVNHPEAYAFCIGLDEFVMLIILWGKFVKQYVGKDWKPGQQPLGPGPGASAANGETPAPAGEQTQQQGGVVLPHPDGKVVRVLDVKLVEIAARVKSGSNKGQLVDDLTEDQCWLELKVQRERGEQVWERAGDLVDPASDGPIRQFIEETVRNKRIPQRGDVQAVAGGPPCQDVSGLNRHARQENVLSSPKNRLVSTYFKLVDLLQPNFILIEQVLDVFKKENGKYARFAVCMLCEHGYQSRVGVVTAGHYGVPQGRRRVFFWGARSGLEQLPAFPEPTHKLINFNTGFSKAAERCVVGFLDGKGLNAHPKVVFGDALSDLPEVHNWCMSDRAQYKCAPERPYQMWMRRKPPTWGATAASRGAEADKAMQPSVEKMEHLANTAAKAGLIAVGANLMCQKRAKKNDFPAETWQQHVNEEVEDEDERELKEYLKEMDKDNCHVAVGLEYQKQLELAKSIPADAPLRDHRPLLCNTDDFLRMVNVPREQYANFRDMPGVVTHANGTCCSGSWHAAKPSANAKKAKPCLCPGGGCIKLKTDDKDGNDKRNRVDHYGSTKTDEEVFRGTFLDKCPARTLWLPSGDLVAPRWVVTYKNGKSNGRHGCFGRAWYDEVQSTVVTRAEPHNLALIHPAQDRVLTIRENARCQGFPDYYALVGLEGPKKRGGQGGVLTATVDDRYMQMGNAVAPPVAAALGRCLALAAQKKSPVAEAVISVPDPEYEAMLVEARAKGLKFYSEENNIDDSRARHWQRHLRGSVPEELHVEDNIDEDNEGEKLPAHMTGDGEDPDEDVSGSKPGSSSRGRAGGGGEAGSRRGAAAGPAAASGQQKRRPEGLPTGLQKGTKKPKKRVNVNESVQRGQRDGTPGASATKEVALTDPPAAAAAVAAATGADCGRAAAAGGGGGGVLATGSSRRRKAAADGGSGGSSGGRASGSGSGPGLSGRPRRSAAEAAATAIREEMEEEMRGPGGRGRKRSRKAGLEEEGMQEEAAGAGAGNEPGAAAKAAGEGGEPSGRRVRGMQQQEGGEKLIDSDGVGGAAIDEDQSQMEEEFESAGEDGAEEEDGTPAFHDAEQMLLPGFDPDVRPSATP